MEFTGSGYVELNETNLFNRVSQIDVFKYYIPEFKGLNIVFCSPLREDSTPSCSIQSWNGTLYYKDFGTKDTFTAVSFVQERFRVNYYDALRIISNDFNLGLHGRSVNRATMGYIGVPNPNREVIKNKETKIRIKRREWNDGIDKKYWTSQGLNKAILRHLNIVPISHLWINDRPFNISSKCPSYAYIIDKGIYKILSPYSEYKWITNCKSYHLQGYNQLPESGDLLIITKSLKDCGLFYKYGYTATAPQSETTLISKEMMQELEDRFTQIVVFFDNDEAGIEGAKLYEQVYGLSYTHIPIGEEKDISDYYVKHGNEETKKLIKELLE